MVFQGEVLPISELLERSLSAPGPVGDTSANGVVGVKHSAAGNAALLSAGDAEDERWRFGILQTLDDYTSSLRRGGANIAAEVFAREPAPTGSARIDAAFAALADHLAERDGWTAPTWAFDPRRRADRWFPAVPAIFHAEAERDLEDAATLLLKLAYRTAAQGVDTRRARPRRRRHPVPQTRLQDGCAGR